MNIALGPNMFGHPAPEELPRNLAELGYITKPKI